MKTKSSISTFCSNCDAFYIPFLQDISVYYNSNIDQVMDCDCDRIGDYQISPLVAASRYYSSNILQSMLSNRKQHVALLIHGTWHDEAEHSWWDYLHEMFASDCEYAFRDDLWYMLHGREGVHTEFGVSTLSLVDISESELLRAIMGVYHSVTVKDGRISFNEIQYEHSLLSLKGQSVMESSWDAFPEVLSGLTAAKYMPDSIVSDVPFTFAVLITLSTLLRSVGRVRISKLAGLEKSEDAQHYDDLLYIGDNLLGGKW